MQVMAGAPSLFVPRTGPFTCPAHASRDVVQLAAPQPPVRRRSSSVMCLKPSSASTAGGSRAGTCSGRCFHHRQQHGVAVGAPSTSYACLPLRRRQNHSAAASSSGGDTTQQGEHQHGRGCRAHEEQQASATPSGRGMSAAAPAAGAASHLASLSRVLLVNQPGSMFRSLANRKWPSAFGPISLLVFLFGTVLALFAAVRGALVRRVKTCKCCKGFGVVRCRLCEGRGTVDWRAKFSYSEMCPLCAAKRFVVCPDCGGHYHRRLFNHARASKGMEAFMPGGGNSSGGAATAAAGVAQRSSRFD